MPEWAVWAAFLQVSWGNATSFFFFFFFVGGGGGGGGGFFFFGGGGGGGGCGQGSDGSYVLCVRLAIYVGMEALS